MPEVYNPKRPDARATIRRCKTLKGFRVLLAALVLAHCWMVMPVMAITRTWTHSNSQFWSDPQNWDPAGTPQAGDDLLFIDDANFTGPNPMINDLAGVTVNSMGFRIVNGYFGTADWVLNGNPVTLTLGIGTDSITADEHAYINCDLILGSDIHILAPYSDNGSDVAIHVTGAVNLNGHTLRLFGSSYEPTLVDLSGVISGTGNIVASGSVVAFSGSQANTFHGTLIVTPGKSDQFGADTFGDVQFNKQSGIAVPERLRVEKSSRVTLLHSEQIADSATVEIVGDINQYGHTGGGSLLLNGFNETISTLVMTNYAADIGACLVDGGGGGFTLNGDISANCNDDNHSPTITGLLSLPSGTHHITTSGSAYAGLDVQAQMSGFGDFQKHGTAALLLDANNTFTGAINVTQGILDVRNSGALGSTAGATTLSGNGSLTLRNVNIASETLYSEGTSPVTAETAGSLLFNIGTTSWGGPIQLDHNLVVYADNTTLSGTINGVAGLDFRNGTAILAGSSANTFSGTTLVRCPLLEFGKPTNVRALNGPLVVGGGSGGTCEVRWLNSYQNVYDVSHSAATTTLYDNGYVNLNNYYEYFGPVTFNGGVLDSGAAGNGYMFQPITVNPAATSATINGNLGLPGGDNRVFIVGDGVADPDLQVNAVIFGSPGTYFVKQGAGTMALAGINTFNAPTLLEEGILDINSGYGLGAWPGLVIFNGATLRISGGDNIVGGFEGIGAGVGGTHGAVEVLPGNSFGMSGGVLLDGPTTLNVGASGGLGLGGAISSSGPNCSLIKTGTGTLVMSGGAHNTYSGDTVVSAGSLLLAKSANKICVPGNLIIGPGPAGPLTFARLIYSGELGGTTVTVNGNGLFDLNGNNAILSLLRLNDGGQVWTGTGTLSLADGSSVNVGSLNGLGSHVASTITGKISLPIGSATFNVAPHASTPPLLFGPELDVPAVISGGSSGQLTVMNKYGPGRMRLDANNTYLNQTRVYEGTLQVDGNQPQSAVLGFGGTLQGIGTVGAISLTAAAAAVAPGDSPGILTCGNFGGGGGGSFNVELNATTPGTGYDQLNVLGTVNLSGITLNASLGYASLAGDQFTLIANDGSDAVSGIFTGLPQGKKLYIGKELFQISYTGGSGNDVVLSRLTTPPLPVLTIQSVPPGAVRLFWATNDPPFSLQTTTNLPSTNWTAALPLPVVNETNNVVTNAVNSLARFYRLSNP